MIMFYCFYHLEAIDMQYPFNCFYVLVTACLILEGLLTTENLALA